MFKRSAGSRFAAITLEAKLQMLDRRAGHAPSPMPTPENPERRIQRLEAAFASKEGEQAFSPIFLRAFRLIRAPELQWAVKLARVWLGRFEEDRPAADQVQKPFRFLERTLVQQVC